MNLKNKVISTVLALSMAAALPFSAAAFSDVSESSWYNKAVEFVSEQGLFNGTSTENFSPDRNMTRGMFITVLGRVHSSLNTELVNECGRVNASSVNFRQSADLNAPVLDVLSKGTKVEIVEALDDWYFVKLEDSTGYIASQYIDKGAYNDVNSAMYYSVYIDWAVQNGISDTNSESFRPEDDITREEMCVMLYNYCRYANVELNCDSETEDFTDSDEISYDAADAVEALHEAGIISGVGNDRFNPSGFSTRAHVAQMFTNLYEKCDITGDVNDKTPDGNGNEEYSLIVNCSGTLNLREGPGLEFDVVTQVYSGTSLTLVEECGDWYKVKYQTYEGYVSAEYCTMVGTSSELRNQIVEYALQYLECPYIYGGMAPSGFDCSGFTKYVFEHFGINLLHSATAQYNSSTHIDESELRPGDLVFFSSSEAPIGHVGIYIGDGNFVHASSGSGKVIISALSGSYYVSHYQGSGRIL